MLDTSATDALCQIGIRAELHAEAVDRRLKQLGVSLGRETEAVIA